MTPTQAEQLSGRKRAKQFYDLWMRDAHHHPRLNSDMALCLILRVEKLIDEIYDLAHRQGREAQRVQQIKTETLLSSLVSFIEQPDMQEIAVKFLRNSVSFEMAKEQCQAIVSTGEGT